MSSPVGGGSQRIAILCAVEAQHECRNSQYAQLWNGLRVRVGVNTGVGNIKWDEVTQSYDYYGTVVNTAARAEAVGHGGQSLVTASAFRSARFSDADDIQWSVTDVGLHHLAGLEEKVRLTQVVPVELKDRAFPPLRTAAEAALLDVKAGVDDRSEHLASFQSDDSGFSASHPYETFARNLLRSDRHTTADVNDLLRAGDLFACVLSPLIDNERRAVVERLSSAWRIDDDDDFRTILLLSHRARAASYLGQMRRRSSTNMAGTHDAGGGISTRDDQDHAPGLPYLSTAL